jgi:5-formyltetrahydrofolate cyclo-ligase
MSKANQRTRAMAHRDGIHPATRARASAAICAHLEDLPEVHAARCVFCYVPFRSEVDTLPFLYVMLDRGKTVATPRVEGPRTMKAVRIVNLEADLEAGRWGIPEPRRGLPVVDPGDIDIMICPGAAFDPEGHRIGYGGGFYDTFVERLRPDVPRLAVAFGTQVLDRVASERHDACVHAIVTEHRVIRTTAGTPSAQAGPAARDDT